jgi:NadR type nicotinamide-nucleotide adenylyltransferase
MYRHGLFIGKFYPPHVGHHAVIRSAGARCERLSVIAMAAAGETIALDDRLSWLRAEHRDELNTAFAGVRCDAPVDVTDERVWAAQLAAMRAAAGTLTDSPIDAVFSADRYGPQLAARLGADLVAVQRPPGSPSGTAIRADLAAGWPRLAPATRSGLTTRVIVVGAESTGTTTVSQQLAAHYRSRGGIWSATGWVAEYGRDYTELKWAAERNIASARGERPPTLDQIVWTAADFDTVAAEQTRAEQHAAANGSPLLVCDTDAFATAIWERRYLDRQARPTQDWALPPRLPRRDLYLVTDHAGVGWHDDGMREGDLTVRAAMTDWFANALTRAGHSWVLLTGTLQERIDLAIRTIDPLLAHRARFGSPLSGPGFESV